ncbi:nickel pincer cofactor biosynthesis protein LarC [Geopsychrobacter electrodiphilus]|uniref:nickel pincer cofactor biosynthesis protein LarC n=1 Tax=Geopsychrobacter electrodiphilus TaxID=225196 RepID=UPI00037E1363|nr:nickel pincer cofactor biosynthesis protein LarC [Geopsychrobacter electrodiphilus]
MKTLYLDCFSGISGDMFLGLLIDLGLDPHALGSELDKLNLPGWQLKIEREQRHGIEGCRVQVLCEEQHHHRHWSDIDQLIEKSALSSPIKDRARRIFLRLGEAEAKVHGISLEEVHFHEVGAIDAIIDMVGAAIGLELLGIEKLICAPLPLSRGLSRCAHGALPLPAPAVLEILYGVPILDSGCDKELVTPSGAAIAREASEFGPLPAMQIEVGGYGVGGWQLEDRPNLLRGLLGVTRESSLERDRVMVLETHIDDGNPEWLGALMDDLLAAGALDVCYSPLQMKKNRPATCLTVITRAADQEKLARLILTGSSASGLRSYPAERYKLAREKFACETTLGSARAKLFFENGSLLRITPEYEDCRLLSQNNGLPLPEAYRIIELQMRETYLAQNAKQDKK